jgi:hypothetical protein
LLIAERPATFAVRARASSCAFVRFSKEDGAAVFFAGVFFAGVFFATRFAVFVAVFVAALLAVFLAVFLAAGPAAGAGGGGAAAGDDVGADGSASTTPTAARTGAVAARTIRLAFFLLIPSSRSNLYSAVLFTVATISLEVAAARCARLVDLFVRLLVGFFFGIRLAFLIA